MNTFFVSAFTDDAMKNSSMSGGNGYCEAECYGTGCNYCECECHSNGCNWWCDTACYV